MEYQRRISNWFKWLTDDPRASGATDGRTRFFRGDFLICMYFFYDPDRWVEDCAHEMRFSYERNVNGNLLGFHMTDMFAIRPAYKRYEVIIRVPVGWKPF